MNEKAIPSKPDHLEAYMAEAIPVEILKEEQSRISSEYQRSKPD